MNPRTGSSKSRNRESPFFSEFDETSLDREEMTYGSEQDLLDTVLTCGFD